MVEFSFECFAYENHAVRTTYFERMHHSPCKRFRILLTRKIQPVHELRVPPLMKCGCRLIVLQSLQYRAIYHNFVVLQLASNNTKCVVLLMMVNVYFAQARRTARWDPFLLAIIVDHHRCSCTNNTLFTARINGENIKLSFYTFG